MTSRRRNGAASLVALGLMLATSPPASAADAVAESLFRTAMERMKAGAFAEACPLLEASQAREARAGTLVILGSCYENTGRTATAWATYLDAVALARAEGRANVVDKAQSLADALTDGLSKLRLEVPPDAPTTMTLTVDGRRVSPAIYGTPFAVDPGEHRLVAVAPGYERWSEVVTIGPEDDEVTTVSVPPLDPVEPEGMPPPLRVPTTSTSAAMLRLAAAPTESSASPLPLGAWIAGSTGIATGLVALGFAIDQRVVAAELDDRCGGAARDACPTDYDFEGARDREVRDQALAIGFGVASAAGLVTATVLALTHDDDDGVAFIIGPTGAYARLRW